jgi:hypothetical protein
MNWEQKCRSFIESQGYEFLGFDQGLVCYRVNGEVQCASEKSIAKEMEIGGTINGLE